MFAPAERLGVMPPLRPGFLCAEFLEFSATRFGTSADVLDRLSCSRATCPGPGHLRRLAELAAPRTGVPSPMLLQLFGTALFERMARAYPAFLVGIRSTVDLIARYDLHIGAELKKLDEGLRPPRLGLGRTTARSVEVVYASPHGLVDLAEGLLRGCVAHFDEPFAVERANGARTGAGRATFRLRSPAGEKTVEP
jgi:hypothetical protein